MDKAKDILVSLDNAGVCMSDKWLVRGVSLDVRRGEIVTLIGPNGSGKSTTAKMALGVSHIRPQPSRSALCFLDNYDAQKLIKAQELEPHYVQQDIGWKKLAEQGKRV